MGLALFDQRVRLFRTPITGMDADRVTVIDRVIRFAMVVGTFTAMQEREADTWEVDTMDEGGIFRVAFLSDDQFQTLKKDFNMKLALWIAGIVVATTVTAVGGKKLYRRRQERKLLTAIDTNTINADINPEIKS